MRKLSSPQPRARRTYPGSRDASRDPLHLLLYILYIFRSLYVHTVVVLARRGRTGSRRSVRSRRASHTVTCRASLRHPLSSTAPLGCRFSLDSPQSSMASDPAFRFTCYTQLYSARCQLRSCGQTKWRGALSHVAPASSLIRSRPFPICSCSPLPRSIPNAPKGTSYTQDTRSDTVSSGPASPVYAGRRQEYKVATPSAAGRRGVGGGDVPLP